MTDFKLLTSISVFLQNSFEDNLNTLSQYFDNCPLGSILLAPELVVTNFCYDEMNNASFYAQTIKEQLSMLSKNKSICITLIEKENNLYFNNAYIFHNQEIIYKRAKNILFRLGDEHLHFHTDKHQSSYNKYPNIITVDGLKIGVLICFELRFTDEWKKLLGCDIILVPAQWGEKRIEHFKVLSRALALTNQCFVVNSNNSSLSQCNQIITPFGEVIENSSCINSVNADLSSIDKMRKYIVLD